MQLKAVSREGKQKVAEGYIPAVAYNKERNLSFAVEAKAFDRVFRQQSTHGLIEIELEGGETVPALVKTVQMDKRRRAPIHADFILVTYGQPIEAPVPVHPTGKAAGVVSGGMLDIVVHNLNIVAPGPRRIPEAIEVDVTALGIGEHITAGQIKLPQGCTLAVPEDTLVITVLPPRLSEEELEAQQQSAQLAGLVASGDLTEEQADAVSSGDATLEDVKGPDAAEANQTHGELNE